MSLTSLTGPASPVDDTFSGACRWHPPSWRLGELDRHSPRASDDSIQRQREALLDELYLATDEGHARDPVDYM
jgi:hypothetical protein